MSVSLKAYMQGDRIFPVCELDRMLLEGGLPIGHIAHDMFLDPIGATPEQCLRALTAALLFHPTYGGDAGAYAEEARTGPLQVGWENRLLGPVPAEVLNGFRLQDDDREQFLCALVALRWVVRGF